LQEGLVAKKAAGRVASAPVSALADASTDETPVIEVPADGTLTVIVDVGQMSVPYTVSYAGTNVIKSFVDRAEDLSLEPGDRVLAWAFAHLVKGWHHTIGVSVNGGTPIVLEKRSEKNKDPDHSVNFAIVRTEE
jgi:hypothetical protein